MGDFGVEGLSRLTPRGPGEVEGFAGHGRRATCLIQEHSPTSRNNSLVPSDVLHCSTDGDADAVMVGD